MGRVSWRKKKALEFDIFVNIELLISLMFIFFEKDKWILYASTLLVIRDLWTLQPEKVLHQLQKCCSPLFYILYLHGKIVIKIWKGYYGIIIVNGFCVLLLSVNLHNKIMNPPPPKIKLIPLYVIIASLPPLSACFSLHCLHPCFSFGTPALTGIWIHYSPVLSPTKNSCMCKHIAHPIMQVSYKRPQWYMYTGNITSKFMYVWSMFTCTYNICAYSQ